MRGRPDLFVIEDGMTRWVRHGDASLAEILRDIAARIGRLSPDWNKPERFFEKREGLVEALTRLAREYEYDQGR